MERQKASVWIFEILDFACHVNLHNRVSHLGFLQGTRKENTCWSKVPYRMETSLIPRLNDVHGSLEECTGWMHEGFPYRISESILGQFLSRPRLDPVGGWMWSVACLLKTPELHDPLTWLTTPTISIRPPTYLVRLSHLFRWFLGSCSTTLNPRKEERKYLKY